MYTPFVPLFYKVTTLDPRSRSSTRLTQEFCDYGLYFRLEKSLSFQIDEYPYFNSWARPCSGCVCDPPPTLAGSIRMYMLHNKESLTSPCVYRKTTTTVVVGGAIITPTASTTLLLNYPFCSEKKTMQIILLYIILFVTPMMMIDDNNSMWPINSTTCG